LNLVTNYYTILSSCIYCVYGAHMFEFLGYFLLICTALSWIRYNYMTYFDYILTILWNNYDVILNMHIFMTRLSICVTLT